MFIKRGEKRGLISENGELQDKSFQDSRVHNDSIGCLWVDLINSIAMEFSFLYQILMFLSPEYFRLDSTIISRLFA